MIKVFEVGVSSFIILIIQFISFDDINCKCVEKTTTFNIMTSNNVQTESLESIKSTSLPIVLSSFNHNNQQTSRPITIKPTTLKTATTTNPFKCKNLSTLNHYPYQFLNPSILQYSNKIQQMKLFPSLNSNIFCSCASICANNPSCDYFFSTTSATSTYNCILYQLNGINSNDVSRGIYFIKDSQISCGFKKMWLKQIF
jgi:hypothetical protein